MSTLYRRILKQSEKAKSNYDLVMKAYELNRATIAARGDKAYEPFQARITQLSSSIPQRIKELNELIPDVTKHPKYSTLGGAQVKIDRKFDRFVKSFLVSDKYFAKRGYSLERLSNLWQSVLDDEKALADLLDPKLLKGKVSKLQIKSRLETGKTKKAERKSGEEQRIEALNQEIQKLEDDIAKILDEDSRAAVNSESKVISLDLVTDWQNEWKRRLSDLISSFPNRSLEKQKLALKLMFDSVIESGDMVVNLIIPAEQQLSQIKYWLDYISTSSEIDQSRLDFTSVKELQNETTETFSLFATVPGFWVQGHAVIDALEKTQKFLDKWYDPFVLIVGDVLRGVNLGWFPGYNDEVEEPFLFESKDHSVKAVPTHRLKDGIYIPPSQTPELKQIP